MDTSDEHFDSLCRTCMNELVQATPQDCSTKPAAQWQSVFDMIEEEGSAFAIAELLSNAVPQIEVQPSDELPKSICSKCIQQLLSFYRFQRMCLQSEEQMRQQIMKKGTCFEMIGEAMEGEIGTNDTDSYPLTSFQPIYTDQNIVHSSIPRGILETTGQMVEPQATKTSDIDNDQSLEHSNESQGELVKNEPIEDDEPSLEYSDGETTLSAFSVKDEEWSIDTEEQQITETNVKALGIAQGEGEPYECPHCSRRFRTESDMLQHKAIHKGGKRVPCDICGKSMFKKHLKTHKLIHSDQKPHKCDFCKKSFAQLYNLRAHIRSHTGERPYKCKYCERSFTHNSVRMKHMRNHLGDNIHRCELCPLAFPVASELRAHLTTHKNDDAETRDRNLKALKEVEAKLQLEVKKGDKRKTCDICGESIVKSALKQHKLSHKDENPHKCNICEKSFDRHYTLRVHIRSHTGERPYKCKYCERSFTHNNVRMKHMRNHLGDNIHRCELCPLAFPVASELRAHLTTHKNDDSETRDRNLKALKEVEAKLQLEVKKGGKRKTCDICGESVIKSDLKQHKLSHKDEKLHKCNICEKSFALLGNLRLHIRKHTGEKPYKCKYCGRSFAGFSLRAQHMRVHLGANIYRCELCPLAFPLASELRVHFLTHTNEDPETRERNLNALKEAEAKLQLEVKKGDKRKTCDICGESIVKSALKQHKLSHKDEKLHKCNICEKSFALLGNLRLHIRKHTADKPYKCKYCDRSFAGISLRAQHMRVHLGANIYRCELCPLAFPLASELRVHFLTHKNEDPETRERNLNALKEAEAKLQLEVKKGGKRKTCDICGESIIKSALKQHKLSHKDEKLHKCNICEKSFAQLCNLRRHIRIHTGEKPYKCKYCERSYSQNIVRMKHMRLHFGDNIHRCELCPLAFPVASELRVHLTTHKNDASETRERNLKALKEVEAELLLKFSKQKTK